MSAQKGLKTVKNSVRKRVKTLYERSPICTHIYERFSKLIKEYNFPQ